MLETNNSEIMGQVPEQVNQKQETEVTVSESDISNAKITIEKLEAVIKAEPEKKKKMAPAVAAALSALALFQSFGAAPVVASPDKAPISESVKNNELTGLVKERHLIDVDGDGKKSEIAVTYKKFTNGKGKYLINTNLVKHLELNNNIKDVDINTNYGASEFYSEVEIKNNKNEVVFKTIDRESISSKDGIYINSNGTIFVIKKEIPESRDYFKAKPEKYKADIYEFDSAKNAYQLTNEIDSEGSYDGVDGVINEFKTNNKINFSGNVYQYNIYKADKIIKAIKN